MAGVKITNTLISIAAAALLALTLGFAYGNMLGIDGIFVFKEWQTLVGTMVAIAAALLAFLGVRSTQRVNVMLREEDRIERALPGLRQTNDLITLLLTHLVSLKPEVRYLARDLIRSIVRPQDGETFETMAKRLAPLADGELQRDVTAVLLRLMTQADMLKVIKDELDRTITDVRNIADFAVDQHEAVCSELARVTAASERENVTFLAIVDSAARLRTSLSDRIAAAEGRRALIRQTVARYFHDW